jgi:predicted nucleic acid-binding Zn finger protein
MKSLSSHNNLEPHEEEMTALKRQFAKYAKYGRKFDRAVETVVAGGVKEHQFLPSKRKILTVVGNLGDEFIDPEKPYCSCSNFFFRVLGQRDELCYHLLSYMIASESNRIEVTAFDDEEYDALLSAVVNDVFLVLDHSSS